MSLVWAQQMAEFQQAQEKAQAELQEQLDAAEAHRKQCINEMQVRAEADAELPKC